METNQYCSPCYFNLDMKVGPEDFLRFFMYQSFFLNEILIPLERMTIECLVAYAKRQNQDRKSFLRFFRGQIIFSLMQF